MEPLPNHQLDIIVQNQYQNYLDNEEDIDDIHENSIKLFLRKTIRKQLQNIHSERFNCASAQIEGEMTPFMFGLLDLAGINDKYGFSIASQSSPKNNSRKRTDIQIQLIINMKVVFVIECKKDITHPTDTINQLKNYVKEANCFYSMILYPQHSQFYTFTNNELVPYIHQNLPFKIENIHFFNIYTILTYIKRYILTHNI